jgi:hypothetical protein
MAICQYILPYLLSRGHLTVDAVVISLHPILNQNQLAPQTKNGECES